MSAMSPAEVKSQADARVGSATALAGVVTVLAAVLSAFGGLTGAVARMARNHPYWTPVLLGAVLLAVALAIAGRIALHSIRQERGLTFNTLALWASVFLFTFGSVGSVILMTLTIDGDDRPSVAAKLARDAQKVATLSGTAEVGGLDSDEELYIGVTTNREIYTAAVGGNQDGLVKHEFSLVLPRRATEVVVAVSRTSNVTGCVEDDDGNSDTACVTLAIPKR